VLAQLQPSPAGRKRQKRDPAAKQDRDQRHANLIDQTSRQQTPEQLSSSKERDVLTALAAKLPDDRFGVGFYRDSRIVVRVQRA
jgi:hypothetical protein